MFGKMTRERRIPILWALLLIGITVQAQAATINVNTATDVINPSDNSCSLREAIIAANTNSASGGGANECPAGTGTDTINLLATTYNLTILGTAEDNAATGDLDILAPMNIVGAGQESTLIYGNDTDRIIDVHSSVAGAVVIRDLELSHGETSGNGGAVRNRADLTIRRVTMFKNNSQLGGGIWSSGDLEMEDCIVDGTLSSDDGGGLYLAAGSQTSITRCMISDNEAGGTGGGIFNRGSLALIQSVVELNEGAWGGGIHAEAGSLTLTASSIVNNTARRWGGGLANENNATITNSTLSVNTATEYGGNIANMTGGDIDIFNSTVADGAAPIGRAIRNEGVVESTNSIFKGSCTQNKLISNGGNLESPANGCGFTLASDQRNVPAAALRLSLLTYYGGPTPVNIIGLGSPAIDNGLNGPCTATDQRGVPRPRDGDDNGSMICDIGAYETPPIIFTDGFESGDTSAWSSTVQ